MDVEYLFLNTDVFFPREATPWGNDFRPHHSPIPTFLRGAWIRIHDRQINQPGRLKRLLSPTILSWEQAQAKGASALHCYQPPSSGTSWHLSDILPRQTLPVSRWACVSHAVANHMLNGSFFNKLRWCLTYRMPYCCSCFSLSTEVQKVRALLFNGLHLHTSHRGYCSK